MKFHHIGMACRDILAAIETYEKLGFKIGSIVEDPIQNVKICFVSKDDHPMLELIEPLNDAAPVNRILTKVGNSPYHNAYTTNDIEKEIKIMKSNGFLLISKPVDAIAIDDHKICFMFNKDLGLIELIQE